MPPDPHETCWTVLDAASKGDAEARSLFVHNYRATIQGYLESRWRVGFLRDHVDDATQEVCLECLRPGGVLERTDEVRGDFRGLLFGVARNVARRFEARAVERGRVRPEDSMWLQQLADDEAGQSTLFDRSWARSLMRQAKERHELRAHADGEAGRRRIELLERRFGDGEAIRHIAAHWGVPAQDVHNAFRKARDEFYRCLREVVALHVPAGADLDAECRRLLGLLG